MLSSGSDKAQGGGDRKPEIPPLDRFEGPLSRRVYLSLREAILSLQYQPGEPLRKREICAELGVSRSPVSEAVARLAAEGLVRVVPQAGTYVSKLSMAEIREGAFLREALELAAVDELAPRIGEAQLAQLRRNLRVQQADVEHGDFPAFYQMDAAFHAMIMDFTGFPRLAQLADTLWVQVNRARQLVLPRPGRVQDTLAEHQAILAALEARDPQAARESMRHHLRQLITYLEPLEKTHPHFFETDG